MVPATGAFKRGPLLDSCANTLEAWPGCLRLYRTTRSRSRRSRAWRVWPHAKVKPGFCQIQGAWTVIFVSHPIRIEKDS